MQRQYVPANCAVQVRNPNHPRHGQAGVTIGTTGAPNTDADNQAEVLTVKFDLNEDGSDNKAGATTQVAVGDVEKL